MNKNDFQPNLDSIDFAPLLSMIGPQSVITLIHQSKTKLKLNVPLSLESFPVIFSELLWTLPFCSDLPNIFVLNMCFENKLLLGDVKMKRDQKGKDRFGMSKSKKGEMEGTKLIKRSIEMTIEGEKYFAAFRISLSCTKFNSLTKTEFFISCSAHKKCHVFQQK